MVLSLLQGVVGNPFGNAVSGPAFGVLNELLGLMRGADGGIAKPSRYEVIFLPPVGNQTNVFSTVINAMRGDGTARSVSLKCEQISMPGRNIDTAPDTNIYGPVREIAQGFSFADIDATFQMSSDHKEKKFFETWQRISFDPLTWAMGYYDDYVGTIQIYKLDEQNERRYGVELIECFPKTIAAQTFDYSAVNQQQKVSVTFSYRYWKNLTDEARLPQSLADSLATLARNTVERQIRSRIPAIINRLTR